MHVLAAGMIVVAVVHVVAVLGLVFEHRVRLIPPMAGAAAIGASALVGGFFARGLGLGGVAVQWAVGTTVIVGAYWAVRRRDLFVSGACTWMSFVVLGATVGAWGLGFLATVPVSGVTRVLMAASVPLVLLGLPAAVTTHRESIEVLVRRRWHRQHMGAEMPLRHDPPFVPSRCRVTPSPLSS